MTTMNKSDSIESLSLPTSQTSNDYDVIDQSSDHINNENQTNSSQLLEKDFIVKISTVLDLDDSTESKMIIKQLMIKGRESLSEYKDDIPRNIFQKQMDNDHSELLELLKDYVEQQWRLINEEWFQLFLSQQKMTSTDLYDQILIRTAEYGSKLMKDNAILSLIIQFLFELDDEAMQNDGLFNKIWYTLITQGRQGIEKYSDHISRRVLVEQLKSNESPLYLALREYYRQPLNDLFQQKEININKPDVIKIVLDRLVDCGWWNVFNDENVQDSIAQKKRKIMEENLKIYLDSINLSSVSNENSKHDLSNTTSESSMSIDTSILQPSNTMDLTTLPSNIHPLTTTAKINQDDLRRQEQQQMHETKIVSMCINEYEKLQLSHLVEAGELMYINQKFDQLLDKIIQDFQSQQNFSTFIQNCLTPIMYLLKRHQSLEDFIESLFFKYSQIQSPSITPKLSLRMIIHILLLNADLSLSRMIMSLLSKRNPVPFLEPSTTDQSPQFVPDIIHVWNYLTPTILSFGIGKCGGKSTLLNILFMSSFEQSTPSIYFQNTIDIDFGYSFLPRRSTNIADSHGSMTKELLMKIHELFDGFIIHIEYEYLLNNFDTVFDLLNIISETNYKLILVRDVPTSLNQQCSVLLLSRFSSNPSIQTFILPNIADQTNKQNKHCILTLREKIFEKIPTKCSREQNYMKNELKQLMTIEYKQHLNNIYTNVMPLKQQLIQIALNNSNVVEYFPEYLNFVELCALQLKLAHFNFYGNENDTIVYDARRRIYELENNTTTNGVNRSVIFDLFLNVLKAPNMLMCLELLTIELKQERARFISASELANQLPIQKSLSLEVLWRNTIVCSHCKSSDIQNLLFQKYYEYISAGFPFEIIDGDNFYFQHQFLLKTLEPFRDKKTLVISVIGPQNSGKSTLLNYMFGTLFDVRDGRCTRGIYGSFVKSNLPDFDYIMLIDTEGLLGVEREDPEYDRRIVLFCLAVSHIVIVNMIGEVSSTLQAMLTLCTDSLEKMGVTRIPQPVVHFILNQKADLNIENNQAAIDRIISDLKKFGLGQSIDIRKETFHTLPSAFKKEGQTLTSNTKLPNVIKTEPDFIERVQLLCGEIIHSVEPRSTKSFEFSDPLQWLTSSIAIFDTLQKFSDLTYYRDIYERRLDNEIREHIKKDLTKIFTSDYRDQLIIESSHKTEDEIKQLFVTKQNKIQESADQNLENLFKLLKAPDTIRIRSRQFLRTQIIEMFNALRTTTIAVNEREKVKLIVRNGAGDLQKLIDDTINHGAQMSSDAAAQEFDKMFDNSIKHIKSKFIPDERLKQAFNYIYTNYNIYEKDCLHEHQHISHHLSTLSRFNESQAAIVDLKDEFISCFTNLAYKHCSVTAHHYNPNTTALYSIEIIKKLVYLNKELLEQEFIESFNQYSPQTPQSSDQKRRDGDRSHNKSRVRQAWNMVSSPFRDNNKNKQKQQLPQETITSTDQFQMHIRNIIQEQKPITLTSLHIDERNMCLGVSKIMQEILQRIMTAMKGVEQNEVRQIRTELIQKVVGLINSLIIDIDDELASFCLTLSRQIKTTFHTCAVILLTKYYYDEQMNHFLQTLSEIENKKTDLKNYFINMVVPNASVDTNYAINLGKKFKESLIEKLTSDGQYTIDSELGQYDYLNRKSMQDLCDGQLMTNTNIAWHMDYIENPTKIIEQFFSELWINIQQSIDQKLMNRKSHYKDILTEFFYCLKGIFDAVRHLGPAAKFVNDIFESEASNLLDVNKNLINKKRCMTILLHKYFSGQSIPSIYTISTITYELKKDALDAFQLLLEQRKPSDNLKIITKEMSSVYDNISIGNLVVFLQSLLDEEKNIMNEFNQIKSDFNRMDTQDTYAQLLDKIRGCPDLCPCCKRPCDVDHTLIKSRPGSKYNEHRCVSGHALRAMNGYKFETTNEASLLMCEQIKDDQIIVVDLQRYRWSQFKLDHSNWNFESDLNDVELNRLHGKFLTLWGKVGEKLCQKHNMKYVTYNTTQDIIQESFHYILLLDGSESMHGKRWDDLIKAVQEFLTRRRLLHTNDRITIIVFSNTAHIAYFDEKIDEIAVTTIPFPKKGTDFGSAFACVNECINRSEQRNTVTNTKNDYAIVFMSDGEASYPERELDKLLQAHDSVIKRFWTLSLSDGKSAAAKILEQINEKMHGSYYDVETSTDLIKSYAEIASSTSNSWNTKL